ncbi:MAG: hypothetical protein KM310_10855 [Clostridiales bacterium]|nr:hypothetical protein [Clostridiales bacterium]
MTDHTRRAVEADLRQYPKMKEAMRMAEAEAALEASTGNRDLERVQGGKRQSMLAVVAKYQKALHDEYHRMRRVAEAIEAVYGELSPILRRVMGLYYWRGMSHHQLARTLYVDESTAHRYRRQIVEKVWAAFKARGVATYED